MSIMPVGLYLCLNENLLPQNCGASVSSVFRGIFGFLLVQAGFVPGKTKKGEKHRKGTLTDDRGSAHANLTFKLEETAMSKKNKQKQQGGQTQPTDTAEK